jgi:methylated-DNA-[protein]-cysteine S-methyltransferase
MAAEHVNPTRLPPLLHLAHPSDHPPPEGAPMTTRTPTPSPTTPLDDHPAPTTTFRVVDSPIGPLTIAGRDGAVTHVCMEAQSHPPAARHTWTADPECFASVVDQLDDYFAGTREVFDVPLVLDGTEFQRQVWSALRDIPYGETRSYGQIAATIGRPGASRAVGLANGRNPVAIIVPCHRVIGASGDLTGYGGGLDRKRTLLAHERDHIAPRLPV